MMTRWSLARCEGYGPSAEPLTSASAARRGQGVTGFSFDAGSATAAYGSSLTWMSRFSFSFALLALLLGLFMGSVLGSLLAQIFGMEFLDRPLFADSIQVAKDFYFLQRLEIKLTPAGLIGLAAAGWFLYKKL